MNEEKKVLEEDLEEVSGGIVFGADGKYVCHFCGKELNMMEDCDCEESKKIRAAIRIEKEEKPYIGKLK